MNTSTSSLRDQFRKEGHLKISNLLDPIGIKTIRNKLSAKIKETLNIEIGDYSLNHEETDSIRISGMNPIMRKLKEEGCLRSIENKIQNEIDNLFGKGRWLPPDLWYSLLSLPGTSKKWDIPKNTWHADEPVIVGHDDPLSIFTFVFLDEIEHGGGATVMISSTHRQGQRIAQKVGVPNAALLRAYDAKVKGMSDHLEKEIILAPHLLLKNLSQESEWFRSLSDDETSEQRIIKFMEEGTYLNGVEHKVVEFTGRPGDIILLDPRCLHSSSAISGDKARQVIRLDFKRMESSALEK